MIEQGQEKPEPNRCPGCYDSFSGPWCDNCEAWPCQCVKQPEGLEATP